MKTIARHILRLRRACLRALPLALLPFVSCVAEDGECPADTRQEGIAVSLVIQGNLPAAGSRALSEAPGTPAESYINIDDLYVLTFGMPEGKDVADGSSVLKDIIWSPTKSGQLKESTISSNGTEVYLRTLLSSEKYNTTDPFALVAVANISKWNGGSYSLVPGTTKLAELQKELTYPGGGGEATAAVAWVPDNAKSDGIPLFGIRKVDLNGYNTSAYNSGNPYDLGTTWLLRALAKIEIFADQESGLEIESAHVVADGWNSTLQLIPFMTPAGSTTPTLDRMEHYSSNEISPDVKNPTYGSTSQVNLSPDFTAFTPTPSSKTLSFTATQVTVETSPNVTEQVPAFVAYLPEYRLAAIAGENPRNDIVRVKFKNNDREYSLSISPYRDFLPVTGTDIYWQYLLRNHLYRFSISEIQDDTTLRLKYTVCPMDKASADIAFN